MPSAKGPWKAAGQIWREGGEPHRFRPGHCRGRGGWPAQPGNPRVQSASGYGLGRFVRGMTGFRGGDEDMALGEKAGAGPYGWNFGMSLTDDGDIAVEVQSLTPQMARGFWKGAERQIGFTCFQLEFELA